MVNDTIDAMPTIMFLNRLTTLFTRYVGITLYGFGLIGALLNMYVFSKSALRSNPCCLFLLALNIVDFLHIHNGLLVRIMQHGFHWDPMLILPSLCQVRHYIVYVLITLYAILLILASCERYASTCKRGTQWRRFSKSATVCYTLLGSTLICCFVCLFVIFCYSVDETSLCAARNGVCTTLTMVYTSVMIGFIPPIFTAVFICLTLRNLRNIRHRSRAAPISYRTYMRIKDANEQLTSMFFMQITAMLVSSLPYASLLVYQLSTRHMNKTPLRTVWEQNIAQFIYLLTYVNYVCSAYVYLATSPVYRQHLMSTSKLSPARFGVGNEFPGSVLMSMSRAENRERVLLMPASSSEVTTEKQHHHPRAERSQRMSSHQELSKVVVDAIINASKADRV